MMLRSVRAAPATDQGLDRSSVGRVALIPALQAPFESGVLAEQAALLMRSFLNSRLHSLGLSLYRTLVTGEGNFSMLGRLYPIYDKPDNDNVARTMRTYPDRFYGWVAVNPRTADPCAEVGKWAGQPGWIGVKAHPFWHRYPVALLGDVAGYCSERGLPLLLHLGTDEGQGDFRYLPERHPRLKIVFAHTGVPAYGALWEYARGPSEQPGDRIGRYKLLQQIGEGGCGVVYMAEQEEPVRRRVALKVIKLGMDTKSVIARFEAERQALALMDHPNIAKVFDAGATDTGRPFFVMELVRGTKITDYCDQYNLSTVERLKLFTQVCQAIQHAHQKGIIHRDIKPSNILVTISEPGAPGSPKVIDFGIAKATTGQRLTDKTVFTAFEQFMGTPAYMSPEQAMMTSLDIDTRTDIYALGVLLYELLSGQTPF